MPLRSYTTRNTKFQKVAKTFKKLKNTIMVSFQTEVGWKRMRKRENKNYRSVRFLPKAQQKIQKKSKKIQKIKKIPLCIHFKPK